MSVYPIFCVTISMLFWSVEKYSLKHYAYLASNPGFMFRILSHSFGEKSEVKPICLARGTWQVTIAIWCLARDTVAP